MAAAQALLLAAVLLCCSSAVPTCPELCTCQPPALLNCSSSGLSSVPQHIPNSVNEIDLSDNLLGSVTLHRAHPNLRNVCLGNNSITHLSLCTERHPEGRYVKGRRRNQLRPWSRWGCVSWAPNLLLLSAERNQLEVLPEGLEGTESLQVLQLSFNRISNLRPGDLSHLRQLQELHLQHNLLTSLHPQMFKNLAQLKVVDLRYNMLTSLHPLMYLSLHNIGADVRLAGNRWKCDCTMRSLRRQMAYASSRGLQAWSVVCASPSDLSGRDLLQLEEDDLNCFTSENGPARHQDVTVYRGSQILLSCSTQDSKGGQLSGQAAMSKPEAGLLIKDITERDTGLYMCVSEAQDVVSVFNLQISKVGGARRKARSLPGSSSKKIPQGTESRLGQARNQRATQSELALAVCLSIIFTFLFAFILGILARPCIDTLCKKVSRKRGGTTSQTMSTVQQRQYDNEGFNDFELRGEVNNHRERRVTFSTAESRDDVTVQYYDTVARDDQESINDNVFEDDATKAERAQARNSGSDSSSQQRSPIVNQRGGRATRGVTKVTEFEHIPDPAENRRHSSSSSDSSLSGHTRPKPVQQAKESIQQRANSSTVREDYVPHIDIERQTEIPGFTTEPFAGWSPHTDHNLADGQWPDNEEQFEFSDRSPSPRSNSIPASFNDTKVIVTSTPDKKKNDSTSSFSSSQSDNETTNYMANRHTDGDFERQIPVVNANRPSIGFNQGKPGVKHTQSFSSTSSDSGSEDESTNYIRKQGHRESDIQRLPITKAYDQGKQWPDQNLKQTILVKRPPDVKVSSQAADSPSSSDSEENRPGKVKIADQAILKSQTTSKAPKISRPSPDHRHQDIRATSPASDSSSSSDSENEKTNCKQRPGKLDLEVQKSHSGSHAQGASWPAISLDHETQWPILNLERIARVKRHLNIKAQSPASDSSSSSDSEDETSYIERPGKVVTAAVAIQKSPETKSSALNVGHTTSLKSSDSSSSSDSEDEVKVIKKQDQAHLPMTKHPVILSPTVSHDPQTQWPVLNLERTTIGIKRRLDIKAKCLSSDSSSSSDSEDETAIKVNKQQQEHMYVDRTPIKVSPTLSSKPQTQWPLLDLQHTKRIQRRLDIKAQLPASNSSSSSDSEEERSYAERPGKVVTAGHVPESKMTALDIGHTTSLKTSDSSSSSESEDEVSYINKQEKVQQPKENRPITASPTVSNDPITKWPVLNLERTTRIKRRLNIKAKSLSSDSSSSSDSEDETAIQVNKQQQEQMYVDRPSVKLSPTVSSNPQTQWPLLDLQYTSSVKRRLDIKAKSPASDSSSTSNSDDETSYEKTPGKRLSADLAVQKSQTANSTPGTKLPLIDLEHTTSRKTSDSSSSSDSEDDANYTRKKDEVQQPMEKTPIILSPSVSHDLQTQWPVLNLEQTSKIKRRLDIKIPAKSLSSDSSSSSDSEDETAIQVDKQLQEQIYVERPPISPTLSGNLQTQWPLLDLQDTFSVKRRLDIKTQLPASDSSSSSDSEDERSYAKRPGKSVNAGHATSSSDSEDEANYIKKQEQPQTNRPVTVSQSVRKDPQTQWPVLNLERTTRIKRRLDIKPKSPSADSSPSSNSKGKSTIHVKKQEQVHLESNSSSSSDSEDETTHQTQRQDKISVADLTFQKSPNASHVETQWPVLDLKLTTKIKRRLDIKPPSPDSDSSSSSDSEDEAKTKVEPADKIRWPGLGLSRASTVKSAVNITEPPAQSESSSSSDESERRSTDILEKNKDDDKLAKLEQQTNQRKFGLGVPYIQRRLDIKAPLPKLDPVLRKSESNSSTSESEDEKIDHTKTTQTESIKSFTSPVIGIPSSPKKDSNIKLVSYTSLTDNLGDETTYQNTSTIRDINPELESQWASMNLGTSRSRKRLEITPHGHGPPKLPSSPLPDSSTSSSSESEDEGKNERTRQKRRVLERQGNIHRESTQSYEVTAVTGTLRSNREDATSSSSSSDNDTIDHSVPDLSLGIPRIKRRLNVKAPSPEPRISSSGSGLENETPGYIAQQKKQAFNMTQPRDTNTRITYRRSIFQPTSPTSESPPSRAYNLDDTKQRFSEIPYVAQESPSYSGKTKSTNKFSSRSFDDLLNKISGKSKRTTDGTLPPELRWTGIGRQMSDTNISSPGRRLNVGLSSPPAEPELPPPDSSSSSSSESDDERTQNRGREDLTLAHQYSSLSTVTPPSSSIRTYDTVANRSMRTNEMLGGLSEEKAERKGLGALKAMSIRRQEWNAVDGSLDHSALRLSHGPRPGVENTLHYQRSAEQITPTASVTLKQVYRSSTTEEERTAGLLPGFPRYRSHDTGNMEPPLDAPPPVPATPPPDESLGLAWRSRPNSWRDRSEGTLSFLTRSRPTGESDRASRFFDSADNPITEV